MALLPEGITAATAFFLATASFVTSALTASFGVGGGVALLALMGYLLPVAAIIPVHGVVQWGSNAGRMYVQRRFVRWDAVLPFAAGAVAGAILGAPFVTSFEDPLLKIALGAFIILVTWAKIPALARAGQPMMVAGGAGTTFLSMFFGASGPLTSVFFAKSFDDRRVLVSSHAAAMTFQHAFKVIAFAIAGFAFFEWLPVLALMIATGYLGTLAGSRLLDALPEKGFRLVFSVVLTLLALDIVRRGATEWLAG
jgi:uncharacterized membrane protein YfcA